MTCIVSLVIGGILFKEVEDGVGTGAMGWVLVVAVRAEVEHRCGTVTREGEI